MRRTGDEEEKFVDPENEELEKRLSRLWLSPHLSAGYDSQKNGTQIGPYVVERMVGSGSFGVVYQAWDARLKRSIALKIPRPEVLADSDKLHRFKEEATIAARLEHPLIVPVYEASLETMVPYIATAFCNGPSLQEWLEEHSSVVQPDEAAAMIAQVAEAVAHAHAHGVIHRDLKPSNIMLVPREEMQAPLNMGGFQPKLTDFGLAKLSQDVLQNTSSSVMLGSPLYMSPEQAECANEEIGPGADVFGLGAILYHMLSGTPPFAADSYPAVLQRLREDTPVPLSEGKTSVDRDLETICLKCLEKDKDDRYLSAQALGDDLRRYRAGESIHARRVSLRGQFMRWCRQPLRIVQVGWVSFIFQIFTIVWMFSQLASGWAFSNIPTSALVPCLGEILLFVSCIQGPKAWFGWKIAQGARWAFLPSALFTVMLLLFLLATAPEQFFVFARNHSSELSKLGIFSSLLMAYGIECVFYLFAVPAWLREKRRSNSQLITG